jgi:hypothetical protein
VFSGLSGLVIRDDRPGQCDRGPGADTGLARSLPAVRRPDRAGARYCERTVADVPADGRPVVVRVRVRRLRCPALGCPVQTFREQVQVCWTAISGARSG